MKSFTHTDLEEHPDYRDGITQVGACQTAAHGHTG